MDVTGAAAAVRGAGAGRQVKVVPDERMLLTVVEGTRRPGRGRSSRYGLPDAGQIGSIRVGCSTPSRFDALSEFVNRQQALP